MFYLYYRRLYHALPTCTSNSLIDAKSCLEDSMYTLSYILYGIGSLFTICFITFLILFIKKKGNNKINLLIFIASIILAVGCFGYGGYHQYDIQQTIAAADDEFTDNAISFAELYKKTADKTTKVGDYVKEAWQADIADAMDNDEDFDATKTVTHALAENADDIVSAQMNLKKLKKYLKEMNDYDTGTYDYEAYKKAYDKLEKLVSFVNDPKGTYDHYTETYSADKSAVANAYKDIEPE